jgi:hypothetical protein
MSSLARLKEELQASQSELHEKEATIEAIRKLAEKLDAERQAQKQALIAKSTELDSRQIKVKEMQTRLNALTAAEPAINAAMCSKSSAMDLLAHVIEQSIRSDHVAATDIVRLALGVAIRTNGRTRADNVEDLLVDLIEDQECLKAAIESAMATFASTADIVKCSISTALKHGAKAEDLTEAVAKTVFEMLGSSNNNKTTAASPITQKPIGRYHPPPSRS